METLEARPQPTAPAPKNLAATICAKAETSEELSNKILSGLRRLEQRLLGIGQELSSDKADPGGGFLSFLDTNHDNVNGNLHEALDALLRIEKEIE